MPPANDNFASATAFSTTLPDTIASQSLTDATFETGEENSFGGSALGDQSVWYSFTPTSTGKYNFVVDNVTQTGATARYHGISIYTGAAVGSLTRIARYVVTGFGSGQPDDFACGVDLTSGVTYHIKVWSPIFAAETNPRTIDFDITLSAISGSAPANDDVLDATDLGIDPTSFPVSGDTTYATMETFESVDFAGTEPTVWYRFECDAITTRDISVEHTGSNPYYFAYLELWEILNDPPNDPINDLSFIDSSSDSYSQTATISGASLTPGTKYAIDVQNYIWNGGANQGDTFELSMTTPAAAPPNDNFVNRTVLQKSYKVSTTGTTAGATTEGSEPVTNPGGVGPYDSVWYEWTAPNYGNTPLNFQIDTLGSTAETYLEVFTGSSIGGLTLIASDHNSGAGGKSQLTLNAVGDTVYKIRVSSPPASPGTFNLNITAQPGGSPPANDNFANAELMTGYSDSTSGTTVGAGAEAAEQTWDGFFDQGEGDTTNTVWYKWVPPQTGRVRVELDSDGSNLSVQMARGATLASLQEVQFFVVSSSGSPEYDYVTVEGGVDYYFVVFGNGGDEGTFDLSFYMENVSIPTNNNPATPTIIPFTAGNGTITDDTKGSYFDDAGEYAGDFITSAQNDSSLWYKIIPTRHAMLKLHVNNDVVYNNDSTWDAALVILRGDTYQTAVQIAPTTREGGTDTNAMLEPGQTYWIVVASFYWSTTLSWTYTLRLQDPRENGVEDWDSITGTFVEDDDNPGTWVAQGGVGYGTINYPDGHWTAANPQANPGGWWVRFEFDTTSGDYLYRYGQTQQFVEIFRATREDNTYESIGILGHVEGKQTVAYYQNGTLRYDTGHAVHGANSYGSSSKVRIECGGNGLTVDGTNFFVPTDEGFVDTPDNQFTKFDAGIVTYPGIGTAYAPDPNWEIRISDFKIHDNPAIGVMGPADPQNKEVSYIHGWTTGTLVRHSLTDYQFSILSELNPPTVVVSAAEYSDGYSLDVNVETGVGNDLNACGVTFKNWQPTTNIQYDAYGDSPIDTNYPGVSFRFYIHDTFPASTLKIARYFGSNGWNLYLGNDGTLYIQPSGQSQLIPFCFVNVNEWNYIEIMWDGHGRPYSCSIWMGNGTYIGKFEDVITNPININQGPQFAEDFQLGRIDISSTTIHMEFRDVAITRCKHHRPLGPTIVIPKNLNGTGVHHYPAFPDDDAPPTSSTIINNGDFTGSTDGAGQPQYWTSYDRFDSPIPPGAMKLDYLGQTLADSICSIVTDGSGPPGLESLPALQIEAVANDEGYETGTAVGYVVGNGADVKYDEQWADTISMQFWIKGKAGWECSVYGNSGVGTLDAFETFPIYEDDTWQYMRTFMKPQSIYTGGLPLTSFILQIDGMDVGDFAYVKDVNVYINADNNNWYGFYYTADNGTNIALLQPGESDSWQLINDFPADTNSDHIYANVQTFQDTLRGREPDGKTHLPPKMYDYYLEYTFQNDTPTEDRQLWGAKLLMQGKSYDTNNGRGRGSYTNYGQSTGPRVTYANDDNDYRSIGDRDMKSSDYNRWGITLKRPPGLGRWGTEKWNATRLRFGMHAKYFITEADIIADFSDAGVLEGVMAELLVYDRRLRPPNCVRPIDLSRIRFRAYETPQTNTDEVEN